jgi:hypothetical protein
MYYLAVNDFKIVVELLAGATPPVMAPKPELRGTSDALLQHLEINIR